MKDENFNDLIENISTQLKDYVQMYEEDKNDIHKGIIYGMYYVADSIQNMISIKNEINNESKYIDFINLIEEIEKKYIL